MGLVDKLIILSFALIIIALLIVNNFNVTYQEFDLFDCDSGVCDSRELSLSRSTVVGDYLCSETITAQAFIDTDRSYDSLYVFNRDGAAVDNLFAEEIGGHGGIVYQLLSSSDGVYEVVDEKRLLYSEAEAFSLEEGVSYRVDVYTCDLPSSLATCSDTDEGTKPLIFGTTTTSFGVYEDTCTTETFLLERYCDSDNSINSKVVDCSEYGSEYVCEMGACVDKGFLAPIKKNLVYWLGGLALLIVFAIYFFNKKKKTQTPLVGKNRPRRFTKR